MRILVLHSEPSEIEDFLRQELKEHELYWATCSEEVDATLSAARPEVVFSIKHSGFPGSDHAKAFRYPTVRWFHIGGSGWDHLWPWWNDVVTVTNSAGDLAPFHAERAMAALLALTTGLPRFLRRQNEKCWEPSRFSTLLDKTLLIVGFGRTGFELGVRAHAFGMNVMAVNRSRREGDPWVTESFAMSELPRLWPRADVVSLNVPLNEETRGLVGREQLALMPRGSYLLNGSRGGVLCESALIEALEERLAGAWLDVTATEPLSRNSPLWDHPRVILTPHCADQVDDFPLRFARSFVDNFRRYENGEPLLRVVKP